MEIGIVGLGRMGGGIAQRLMRGGHSVTAFDPDINATRDAAAHGAVAAASIADLVSKLATPRTVWVMVPSGDITESAIRETAAALSKGDLIIDGGNSNYKDTMRRARELSSQGISFMDVGTSGGIWGLREGFSLMIGGDKAQFERIEPIFKTLAPSADSGYGHVGPSGAGHFVKMVHNGIEYGMMQAFAEGFEILDAKKQFDLDLAALSDIWRHGSVVRSWLLDLISAALHEDGDLSELQAYVEDSGEGRWTVQESIDLAVPAPVITASLQARFRSRQDQPFGGKLLAAMRNQFGGHSVRKAE